VSVVLLAVLPGILLYSFTKLVISKYYYVKSINIQFLYFLTVLI